MVPSGPMLFPDINVGEVPAKLDVLVHYVLPWELHISGFPQRLEKGHGKVMEHEKLAKSHGIL